MRPLPSLAVLGLSAALAACGGEHRAAPRVAAVPRGERLVLELQTVPDLKPVAATVTTRRMGEARARIGGTLVRLDVKEGDEVREGQVVGLVVDQRLSLETRSYAALAAATAAQAARAEADYARVKTLYEKGIYARARLDQAEADARAAQGSLAAARAQQAASAELGAQGAILAPATGRVLHAEVPAGSVVTPGQTVAVITAGQPLLRLEVPEAQGRALRVGQEVRLTPGDLPGAPGAGRIIQVYPAVTGGQVSADVAAAGLTPDLIGRRVRVMVQVGERSAVTVPSRFVATRYGIDYVRVIDPTGRASDVAVQLAPTADASRVEVLSGVGRGDVILAPQAGG